MKRRVLLLLGASTLTVASVAGFGVITASPAAAQTTPPPGTVGGYVLSLAQCFTSPSINIGTCIAQNLRGLFFAALPNFAPAPTSNAAPTGPTAPGSNAPSLNLAANVSNAISSLPPVLQTTPVANAAAPTVPLRQLVPTKSSKAKSAGTALRSALPKAPTAAQLRLRSISDSAPESNAGSPISSTDVLMLVGLGVVGAGAVTAVTRRRVAAVA